MPRSRQLKGNVNKFGGECYFLQLCVLHEECASSIRHCHPLSVTYRMGLSGSGKSQVARH